MMTPLRTFCLFFFASANSYPFRCFASLVGVVTLLSALPCAIFVSSGETFRLRDIPHFWTRPTPPFGRRATNACSSSLSVRHFCRSVPFPPSEEFCWSYEEAHLRIVTRCAIYFRYLFPVFVSDRLLTPPHRQGFCLHIFPAMLSSAVLTRALASGIFAAFNNFVPFCETSHLFRPS